MTIKYKCPNCGAIMEGKDALQLLVLKSFIPVEIEEPVEKPKPKPKVEKPVEIEPVEDAEEEDLTLD